MKILVVITDSKMGGVTTAAVNFCNELIQRGNEVFLLDMSSEYLCKGSLDRAIKIGSLKGQSCYWNLGKSNIHTKNIFKKIGVGILGIFKKLTVKSGVWYNFIFKKYKEFGEFDVAIAFRQCAPCYSFVLNKVKAKKKIGFVHGELKYMGDISIWLKYMPDFEKIAYVSNAVKKEFIEKYPQLEKNACTIYNMHNFNGCIEKSEEETEIKFEEKYFNIITISRIDNWLKATNRIPTICKELKEKVGNIFRWYIVGDGPDRKSCEEQTREMEVEDVLFFLGEKDNPYNLLSRADLSVLPTKCEAYGLVVVESLILGVPPIVAEYPALYEILENNKTGLICKQDINDIADKIISVMKDCDLYKRLKENCLAYHYSNDTAYEQFMTAIQ